jgi:hypothetical protein
VVILGELCDIGLLGSVRLVSVSLESMLANLCKKIEFEFIKPEFVQVKEDFLG